jgi:hypothetical protein
MTFPSRYIASALVFYCESSVVVGGQSRARREISIVIEGLSWLECSDVDGVLASDVSKSLSDLILQGLINFSNDSEIDSMKEIRFLVRTI